MEIKKLAATTAMAGALGLSAFALGSGLAQADPPRPDPGPHPGISHWGPGDPPGHNPFGPPGQVKKAPEIVDGVPNPLYGVPPGHWDNPARLGIPDVWLPPVELRPDFPDLQPLKVEWNAEANAFGVTLENGVFIAYR
ncbi:hypothetical protein AU198_02475 [Mycobacterium sp. GA-1199]|uniref:hypothetical protein n=1 Tax=Mycobacterium sp. GA-1199 TaxID=1772287 RepID=UPI0007462F77|nr:hypothetical protein [Mycobacterium sp. GA-1199]KUI46486.1 hypothetical protein AU198_02475 [Mycobacterium sp. GA-1199]